MTKLELVGIYIRRSILWASQVVLMAKNPLAHAGDARDVGLIHELGRTPGGGHGNPLQYSCLENPVDRGAWRATVYGVTESDTTEATWHAWMRLISQVNPKHFLIINTVPSQNKTKCLKHTHKELY